MAGIPPSLTARQPISPSSTPQTPSTVHELDIEPGRPPITALHRSFYILVLASLYAVTATIVWVLTCVAHKNEADAREPADWHSPYYNPTWEDGQLTEIHTLAHKLRNGTTFLAIKLVQAGLTILTIPLVSAICSQAAVAYLQRQAGNRRGGATLRQAAALADKSWTSPLLILRVICSRRARKRYGSKFLLSAIALMALGEYCRVYNKKTIAYFFSLTGTNWLLAGIAVNLMLSGARSSSTEIGPQYLNTMPERLVDLQHHLQPGNIGLHQASLVTATRVKLSSTNITDIQERLWFDMLSCDADTIDPHCLSPTKPRMLANMTTLKNPLWGQIDPGSQTGLVRQFAPRVNWTTSVSNSTLAEFRTANTNAKRAKRLNLEYTWALQESRLSLALCLGGNSTHSKWKAQRTRQDLLEDLYLKVDMTSTRNTSIRSTRQTYFYRISLNTSAGYFELPNFMTKGDPSVPPPLLDDIDPIDAGEHWPAQEINAGPQSSSLSGDCDGTTAEQIAGPRLVSTLALFGDMDGSPINPASKRTQRERDAEGAPVGCSQQMPLAGLLPGYSQARHENTSSCRGVNDTNALAAAKADFIRTLLPAPDGDSAHANITKAFSIAAFLAIDAIMTGGQAMENQWQVRYDSGQVSFIPTIGRTQLRLVSVVLDCFLSCILAVAAYSAITPRWTSQLDAFAMMRIGASQADNCPLLVARRSEDALALDTLPGWIGEGEGTGPTVAAARAGVEGGGARAGGRPGNLTLGGRVPLARGKLYRCYSHKSGEGEGESDGGGTG
ncbi:proteinrelated to secreted protein- sviceus [Purpureocillium lavendulum]|uniref:Proteinrelated to secreted protein- sviceus n=1 Tax=Purpureocillium lavendulum TaxID=1247861 RepID=A0AB34FKP8_9HYPO|nr:proteinrelated to secreted protein- sviceus [Purpureocillium lavendulum]